MAGNTRVTPTNSMSLPLYNGKLIIEHTFSLPTFASMQLGPVSYCTELLMRTFDEGYVNYVIENTPSVRTIACLCQRTCSFAFEIIQTSDRFSGSRMPSGWIYYGEMFYPLF